MEEEEESTNVGSRGGINFGPLAVKVYKTFGPRGVDWIHRHFMTDNYRHMINSRRNEYVRGIVKKHQRTHIRRRIKNIMGYKRSIGNNVARPAKKMGTMIPIIAKQGIRRSSMSSVVSKETQRHLKAQNLLYTWYQYNMHPLMYALNVSTYDYNTTSPGIGPALYWQTDEALTLPGPVPNQTLGYLRPALTAGNAVDAFPAYGMIYVFAADWIGATMNPDTKTQSGGTQQQLAWLPFVYGNTTDANSPILITDILGSGTPNKDWSTLQHYCTCLTFDFTNLAPYQYTVEIMFFKFLVDPHDMSYMDMCLAPLSNQTDMQTYCEEGIKGFGTSQIVIVHKKRFTINGIDNSLTISSTNNTTCALNNFARSNGNNNAKYSFKVKRKYNINRPVLKTVEATTDDIFFNKYYIAEQGTYCRIQAWPSEPFWYLPGNGVTNTPNPQINNTFDTACSPNHNNNLTVVKPAVQCIMHKKSYFKFDKPILKGPFRTD